MKAKKTLVISSGRCKACGLCIHFCPKGALSLGGEFNEMGYNFVTSDGEKCVKCGTCQTMCPDVALKVKEED